MQKVINEKSKELLEKAVRLKTEQAELNATTDEINSKVTNAELKMAF